MCWINETLVNGTINLLLDMPKKFLPGAAAGGWQGRRAFFLQTRPQLGLSATLGTIPLVPGTQVLVECAVVLARAGGDEVGNAHINDSVGKLCTDK